MVVDTSPSAARQRLIVVVMQSGGGGSSSSARFALQTEEAKAYARRMSRDGLDACQRHQKDTMPKIWQNPISHHDSGRSFGNRGAGYRGPLRVVKQDTRDSGRWRAPPPPTRNTRRSRSRSPPSRRRVHFFLKRDQLY